MNRRYISLTGISTVLTAHVLPVFAQVAPAPVTVHFMPGATQGVFHQVHSNLSQSGAHPQVWAAHAHAQNQNSNNSHGQRQSIQSTNASNNTTGGEGAVSHSASTTSAGANASGSNSGFGGTGLWTGHNNNNNNNNNSQPGAGHTGIAHLFQHHNHQFGSGSGNYNSSAGFASQSSQSSAGGANTSAVTASVGHHLSWQNNLPTNINNSLNLDLSSTAQSATLGHLFGSTAVVIEVGGARMQVTSSTNLTAAEKVAALQVISTGQQTLVLDTKGAADGGSMTITPWLSQHLGNLVIPEGVSVSDVSKSGTLTLKGSLTDSGSLVVTSGNSSATSVSVNAANITVNSGGVLSDVQSSSSAATAATALNFKISAVNNIANAGTINSSGALALVAGGSISNTSQAAGPPQPLIHATGDLSLTSGAGKITNSGTVSSASGGITLSSAQPTENLTVNAVGGTFEADKGAINLQPASNVGSGNVVVTGGDWLSEQLNFNGGTGAASANLGNVTGLVNVDAAAAHVIANTANLNLGTMNISGDPTFYNTNGSVTLSSNPNVTGDLAIVASQDVIVNAGLTASPNSTQLGSITLIAGADITTPSSGSSMTGDSTTTVTLTGGSTTGGAIQVSGPVTVTNSTTLSSPGNFTAVAYSGSGIGSVNAPGTIDIKGAINTNNGNVVMIAGATTGTAIQTGDIVTSGTEGATHNAGSVTLITAAPSLSGSTITILDGTVSGGFKTTALTSTNSAISTGNITASGVGGSSTGFSPSLNQGSAGGNVYIQGGGGVTTGWINNFGGGGGGGSVQVGSGEGGAGGKGGSISVLSSNGAITVNGELNTSGGGGGGTIGAGTAAVGGNAGNITVQADGSITVSGPILAAGGGNGAVGGTAGSTPLGAAGGGSFGGGGGAAGTGMFSGDGGGGGYYGGGGSGSAIASTIGGQGGAGGGGGFLGGGGGGGGGSGEPGSSGGGAGGGGGLGAGGAGGIGQAGGPGGGGGTAGGAGSFTPGGPGSGGAGGVGGGAGEGGSSDGGGIAGNGGAGGGVGSGTGNNIRAGGLFGVAGTSDSPFVAAGSVGTSGSGGQVSLTGGGSILLPGTVASLDAQTGSSIFSLSPYSGQTINASGVGGKITVAVSSPGFSPTYFTDANYASGAQTYIAPVGGVSSAGSFNVSVPGAISVTAGGISPSTPGTTASAAVVSVGGTTGSIVEAGNIVHIQSGSMVTPAEWIAFVESKSAGGQTLVLNQTSSGSAPGTGYASGGIFTIDLPNLPGSGFSSLVLPGSVIEKVTANVPILTYSGSALINGQIIDAGSIIKVGGTTSINDLSPNPQALVNFTGSAGGTLSSAGTISGTGEIETTGGSSAQLTLSTINGNIGIAGGQVLATNTSILSATAGGAGSSVNIANSGATTLVSSGANGSFSIQSTGNLTIDGDINSAASPGAAISLSTAIEFSGITILEGTTGGTLYANSVNLLTSGGNIGGASPISVSSSSVSVDTQGFGNVAVQDAVSGSITTGSVGGLTFRDTATNGTLTANKISAMNGITLEATGAGGSVDIEGIIDADAVCTISTAGSGGITQGSGSLLVTAPEVDLSTGSLSTPGGDIGGIIPISIFATVVTVGTHATTNTSGVVNVENGFTVSTLSTTSQVGGLDFTNNNTVDTSTQLNIGAGGINSLGDVSLKMTNLSSGTINISGQITAANSSISLTSSGPGAQITGTELLTANQVNFMTGGGGVETMAGTAIAVSAPTVTVNTTGTGDAIITDNISGKITTTNGATVGSVNNLNFADTASSGTLALGVIKVGNSAMLSATGAGGAVDIEGNVTSSNTTTSVISIASTGSGGITQGSGFTTTGHEVDLSTGSPTIAGGNIGSGTAIVTDVAVLTVGTNAVTNATGVVNVTDSNPAILLSSSSTVGGLTFFAHNSANPTQLDIGTSGITSVGDVSLTVSPSGQIFLDHQITATNSTLSLTAPTIMGSGLLTANVVTLIGSKIGSAGSVQVSAPTVNLVATATGGSSVSVNDNKSGDVGTGSAPSINWGSFTFTDSGSKLGITADGINASTVNLTGTASGAGTEIDLTGNISGASAGGTANLTASGSSGIVEENASTISATTVNLVTSGGDIGSATAGSAIGLTATTVNVNANGAGALAPGNGYLQNSAGGTYTAISPQPSPTPTAPGVNNLIVADTGAAITVGTNGILATGDVILQGAGASTGIILTGNATTASTAKIELDAMTGSISGSGILSASTVTLVASGFVGGNSANSPLNVQAPNVVVTSGMSANIDNNQSATLTTVSSLSSGVSGTLRYLDMAAGPTSVLTIGSQGVSAQGGVSLTDTGINLTGNVSGNQNDLTVGFGGITGPGILIGTGVNSAFNLNSGGQIGLANAPIQLQTSKIAVDNELNATYLTNNQNVKLDNIFSPVFSLKNSGDITLTDIDAIPGPGKGDGQVSLYSTGTITLPAGGFVTVESGYTEGNPTIQFANVNPGGNVTVVNDGVIRAFASASGGIVGFNGGSTGTINVTGTGTIFGAESVNFGNLDPVTLIPIDGTIIPNTASFIGGLISFSQSTPLANQIIVTLAVPPPPPTLQSLHRRL